MLIYRVEDITMSKPKSSNHQLDDMHRIPASFTKDMMEWLDKVARDAKFSGGASLRITQILRALVKAGMKLDVDVSGVKDEEELLDRIIAAIQKKGKKKR
ncbi:MAG: hypothetical protein B1H03_06570 [Planctomycetales bacterium 4484_113]|nr:MAG: hypothetical protein B1H03_06570 [Planctomycetales bacterium 4484_113]